MLPFENLERDLRNIYRAIVKHYPGKTNRKAQLNFQLAVIRHPFFRNKAAYLVGRMINGREETAFALPILNNENGGLYIDALVLGEKQLSVVFSYSQAYFMMEHQVPSAVVSLPATIAATPRYLRTVFGDWFAQAGQIGVLPRLFAPLEAFQR